MKLPPPHCNLTVKPAAPWLKEAWLKRAAEPSFDSDSYCTPRWLTALLPTVTLDPCTNQHASVIASKRYDFEDDGYARWKAASDGQRVFLNPPYSRGNVQKWVNLAIDRSCEHEDDVLLLLKDDASTKWYANLVSAEARIWRFTGRLAFEYEGLTAPSNNFCSILALLYDGGYSDEESIFAPAIDRLIERGILYK